MKKLLLGFLFAAFASLISQRAYAQVIVIANPSVKASTVSKAELSDVFTGNATALKDGSHAVPVLLKSGTTHEEFLKEYIGRSDSAYRAGWRSLVFSGQGAMPKSVESDAAAVDFVSHNAGAIGYISKATPHEGVKVLAIK
jgi:ABC-type phosphate transport system substrate-binding protein